MKTFNEAIIEVYEGIDISHLNESEVIELKKVYLELDEILAKDGIEAIEKKLSEGFLGGALGFIFGPAIGKIVANALGVEKGILFDMLTSRLVSSALGDAIQRNAK